MSKRNYQKVTHNYCDARRRFLTSVLVSAIAFGSFAQPQPQQPTLVIGIVIDQLRTDYLNMLISKFGNDGFRRLINNGTYFEDIDFGGIKPDAAAATAEIYTGTYPRINGIASSYVYNLTNKIAEPTLLDKSNLGNFTSETYSPKALATSTITDELCISSGGGSQIYAIAPDATQAIIMAGHNANCATWINDVNGNWSSTTYYRDFPAIVQQRNHNNSLAARLDTLSWRPLLNTDEYPNIATRKRLLQFKYVYKKDSKVRYKAYKQSGMVNEEVTNVAIDHITALSLGKHKQTDMLNIAYTVAPYAYSTDADNELELQDTYIRLDRQLERLFKVIDSTIGHERTVIFVTGTGYFSDNHTDDPKYRIPTGDFYPQRAKSLLNTYLMAIYGTGDWVLGYDQNQIFLNRELIRQRSKDISEMRSKAAEFLRRMSGVAEAYTYEWVVSNPTNSTAERMNRACCLTNVGDIFLDIMPGWKIIENEHQPQNYKIVRSIGISTPAFLIAPNIKPQRISYKVDATAIAPTVSSILHIRSPNAAAHTPINL